MIKKRTSSFKYAINGIIHCYSQPNMIIHAVIAIVVILSGIVLKLSVSEWTIILLTIGMVKAAEAFNTAIEATVDLISPEINEKAGIIKDIAAGAVLITSITAAAVGIFIFLPKILTLISQI